MPDSLIQEKIAYNSENGSIAVNEAGRYLAIWNLTLRNPESYNQSMVIEFRRLTPTQTVLGSYESGTALSCNSTVKIAGAAIFDSNAGDSYALVNSSEGRIQHEPCATFSGEIILVRVG